MVIPIAKIDPENVTGYTINMAGFLIEIDIKKEQVVVKSIKKNGIHAFISESGDVITITRES